MRLPTTQTRTHEQHIYIVFIDVFISISQDILLCRILTISKPNCNSMTTIYGTVGAGGSAAGMRINTGMVLRSVVSVLLRRCVLSVMVGFVGM